MKGKYHKIVGKDRKRRKVTRTGNIHIKGK
jgi:hypothetical protein